MPSQTSFAKLYLYNDSTDKEKKFIEFRSNLCGTAEDSNMNKIDTLLSSQNTKLNQIFVQDKSGNSVVNASLLNLKEDTYFENVAGTYNAICAYSSNTYALTLTNTNINISENIFTLRFAAPNSYQENSNFVFGGTTYTPVDPAFETGQVVLINFDKSTSKCYFSSITVDSALSDTSTNPVQNKVVKATLDNKQAAIGSAGDSDTPIYFSNGNPVACTGYMVKSDSNGYYIEI